MTEQSRELALCVINENTEKFPYSERVELGKQTIRRPVMKWASMVARYSHQYEREWDGAKFTTEDVLLAAAELAEYYENHVKEMNAA